MIEFNVCLCMSEAKRIVALLQKDKYIMFVSINKKRTDKKTVFC